MEAAIPFEYLGMFTRRGSLWRLRDDFTKVGVRGLYVPSPYLATERAKEAMHNALTREYWSNIGRSARSQFNIGFGWDFIDTNLEEVPYTAETLKQAPSPKPPKPKKTRKLPKFILAGIGTAAIAFGVLAGYSYFSREDGIQQISSPTTYVATQGENIRDISKKFGVPVAVIMDDNNLPSEIVSQSAKLAINPVVNFRKIPKDLGRQLYSSLQLGAVYEDAFIADIESIGKRGSLETVVMFRERAAPMTHFLVLDAAGRKLGSQSTVKGLEGRNYEVHPIVDRGNLSWFLVTAEHPEEGLFRHEITEFEGFALKADNNFFDKVLQRSNISISYPLHFRIDKPYGRHVNVLYNDGKPSSILVTNWAADGKITSLGRESVSLQSALASDEPFSITRYKLSGGIENITTSKDLRVELARLFSAENLARDDLAAMAVTAIKNNQHRQQIREKFGNVPIAVKKDKYGTVYVIYSDHSQRTFPKGTYSTVSRMVQENKQKLDREASGLILQSTINEAITLADDIQSKKPELYVIATKAVHEGKDPIQEITRKLDADPMIASSVFYNQMLPNMYRVDPGTGELESLEITLYSKEGRMLGIPYKDDLAVVFGVSKKNAGEIRLRYISVAGRDGFVGIGGEIATSIDGIYGNRIPETRLIIIGEERFIPLATNMFASLAVGDNKSAAMYGNELRENLDWRFDPETEDTIRDVRTISRLVGVLYSGGTPQEAVNTLAETPEEGQQLYAFMEMLKAIGQAADTSTVRTSQSESGGASQQGSIPDINQAITDIQKAACEQLKIGC